MLHPLGRCGRGKNKGLVLNPLEEERGPVAKRNVTDSDGVRNHKTALPPFTKAEEKKGISGEMRGGPNTLLTPVAENGDYVSLPGTPLRSEARRRKDRAHD